MQQYSIANKEQAVQPLLIPQGINISYLAGSILKDEQMRFKKMIFRATRGKALTYFKDFEDSGLPDYAGRSDNVIRTVYVVIFQDGSHVRDKL